MGVPGSDAVLDAGTIKLVNKDRYLGLVLTSNGQDDSDISREVNQNQALIWKLHLLLRSYSVTSRAKLLIFMTVMESCVIYGAEM